MSEANLASRLEGLLTVVVDLAAGNFSARATVSSERDELDALVAGINMLAEEIEAKLTENARLVATLERNVEAMAAQNRTIMQLSTPSLLVWRGIVVLPLIGVLDTNRAQNLCSELLTRIVEHSADVVILDVTGVATFDAITAQHLRNTFAAARLLGAQCVLTGMSAANAQSMIDIDLDIQAVTVRSSLHEGLKHAFSMTGRRVLDPNVRERR